MNNDNAPAGFAERLRRRVDNSPVPAARSAAVLTQMLFGVSALAMLCWSGWCLGWLSMNAAANALVMAGLLVAALYGMCLQRYYRGLQMPRLEGGFKAVSMVVWITLGGLCAECVMHRGALVASLALLTMLYLVFVFLGVLISRGRPRELWLLAASTLCGLGGWLLVASAGLCCILRYVEVVLGNPQEILQPFPAWYGALLEGLNRHVGVSAMLLEGLLLILADWWLRLKVYALRSGESLRSFFNWQALLAMAFFAFAVFFAHFSKWKVAQRQAEATAQYALALKNATGGAASAEDRTAFARWQEEFGHQLAEATRSDLEEATRSPYQWRHESAQRWLPAVESAEEHAALSAYLQKILPLEAGFDAHFAAPPAGAQFAQGIFLYLRWRLEAAVQQDDAERARQCLAMAERAIRAQLQALTIDEMAAALGNCDALCAMAERILEAFGGQEESIEAAVASLQAVLEAMENPGGELLRETYANDCRRQFELLSSSPVVKWGAPFERLRWLLPEAQMLLCAEQAALFRLLASVEGFMEEWPRPAMDGMRVRILMAYTVWPQKSLRALAKFAQARIEAELMLAALQRYRMAHQGDLPATLAALVPEYLAEVPRDPLAPERPFQVSQEQMTFEVWNFRAQAKETAARSAVVIRSSAVPEVAAKAMLESK